MYPRCSISYDRIIGFSSLGCSGCSGRWVYSRGLNKLAFRLFSKRMTFWEEFLEVLLTIIYWHVHKRLHIQFLGISLIIILAIIINLLLMIMYLYYLITPLAVVTNICIIHLLLECLLITYTKFIYIISVTVAAIINGLDYLRIMMRWLDLFEITIVTLDLYGVLMMGILVIILNGIYLFLLQLFIQLLWIIIKWILFTFLINHL